MTISRSAGKVTLPCHFLLVAATNPCPRGYLGDPKHECRCAPSQILRYRARLSGPLLDRIASPHQLEAIQYRSLDRNVFYCPTAPRQRALRVLDRSASRRFQPQRRLRD